MNRFACLTAAVLGLSFASGTLAATVNFDTAPGGAAIADDTNIETTYSSVGVTFSCLPPAPQKGPIEPCTVRAYQEFESGVATSTPNTVGIDSPFLGPMKESADKGKEGICESFSASEGEIRADFSTPAIRVSIQAIPDDSEDPAFLTAFDSGGAFITSETTTSSTTAGVPITLEIVADDIAWVRFAGVGGDTVCFDDLVFEGVRGIPALSPLGLGLMILVLLAGGVLAVRRLRA